MIQRIVMKTIIRYYQIISIVALEIETDLSLKASTSNQNIPRNYIHANVLHQSSDT